jgi:hypothetical protein
MADKEARPPMKIMDLPVWNTIFVLTMVTICQSYGLLITINLPILGNPNDVFNDNSWPSTENRIWVRVIFSQRTRTVVGHVLLH